MKAQGPYKDGTACMKALIIKRCCLVKGELGPFPWIYAEKGPCEG